VDVRAGRGAGRYDRTMLGIFPVGDLTEVVEADADASAVILEEPEHRAPKRLPRSAPLLLLGHTHAPQDPRMTGSVCIQLVLDMSSHWATVDVTSAA